ncbi:hypothetical protein EHS25_002197 [Saitozyma podzolica]|uniref:Epoxide hydrolase N-terminal domain-containing protein n=1 Tax=Saitozyma podzolica TaxID=1890683 RepID=A0A427YEZ4_9TREE|nr:hypothetical protein EHS25_002197 [Saitozyma podzolica]
MLRATAPPNSSPSSLDEFDRACLARADYFLKHEFAYRDEHATKTATIGIVVESSPVAMLAWIGEKFISWSDDTPPLDTILADVTLYWLTRTFPTSLYHYRNSRGPHASPETQPTGIRDKPVGYSQFPKEITPSPIEWVKATGGVNLVWAKRHEKGGHFAALERPVELYQDLMDFIGVAWKA